jgi:hypothetical protein
VNRRWLLFGLLPAVLLAGCLRTYPGATPDELTYTARWIEDAAHGIPRRPGELDLDASTPELAQVAAWLTGGPYSDRHPLPHQIADRLARRPAITSALRNGVLLIDPERGLLGPSPHLASAEFGLAAGLADAENHDRRSADAIVLARSACGETAAQRYTAAVIAARVALDTADGGRRWDGTTPPLAR